jgi:glycosyltransferase involved in cell wall biosynthesis
MRIVIDLSNWQAKNRIASMASANLAYAQALIRNCGKNEVIIAVNDHRSDTASSMRSALAGLLPQGNVRVWYSCVLENPLHTDNVWLSRANNRSREKFLTSLRPDIVLVPSLADDIKNSPSRNTELNAYGLQSFDLFLAITEAVQNTLVSKLNVPEKNVVCISPTEKSDSAPTNANLWVSHAKNTFAALEQIHSAQPILACLIGNTDSLEEVSAYQTNYAEPLLKQLFVDISQLVKHDAKSGIQRVVRSILQALLTTPPDGFQIEPVYATTDTPGYRYARQFTARFLGCVDNSLIDEPITASDRDIFLGLDLQHQVVLGQADFYTQLRQLGVRVYFAVYDLLPISMPTAFNHEVTEWHGKWLKTLAQSDGVVCISRAVADETESWLNVHVPTHSHPFRLGWFHLGADVNASVPTMGLPADADKVLNSLAERPTFLSVGTIEPRKGQLQTLKAFEHLWNLGIETNLVIVGNHGWHVDLLVAQLRGHPELNHRLFWLEGVSDEYLEKIYTASTCLIAASEGEGFGLPLIEAAQHKLPIIARDITIFREVAMSHAYYFSGLTAVDLANAIQDWLALYKIGNAPSSNNMTWLTWQQSAQKLLDVILNNQWYRQLG